MEYVPQTKVVEEMRGKLVGYMLACLSIGQAADAQGCLRPIPPYVPEQTEDIRAYSNLLKQDMEAYFADVQRYFRCIDAERDEVFVEARRVTGEYGRVLNIVSDSSE